MPRAADEQSHSTLDLHGDGAVYIRVSTDDQDTARQYHATAEWLGRHGVDVRDEHRFEDKGWARSEARRRPEFNRMLDLVDKGRIQWIVVDSQDRFGTGSTFEFFHYMHRLNEAG